GASGAGILRDDDRRGLSPLVQQSPGITAVAHAIQLAVAPVFLLSGIGAVLAVLTNRLSRIIDRGRTLEAQLATSPPDRAAKFQVELATLSRRAQLIGRAITLCTVTALLVCTVIATLFLGAFARFDASVPVALWLLLAIPGAEPFVAPAPERGRGFAWNQDTLWRSLETAYVEKRLAGCRTADRAAAAGLSGLAITAERLGRAPMPSDAAAL